jgi:hypothetical protein
MSSDRFYSRGIFRGIILEIYVGAHVEKACLRNKGAKRNYLNPGLANRINMSERSSVRPSISFQRKRDSQNGAGRSKSTDRVMTLQGKD